MHDVVSQKDQEAVVLVAGEGHPGLLKATEQIPKRVDVAFGGQRIRDLPSVHQYSDKIPR